jgi:Domain of unknown function (DUF4936)
MHVHYFVWYEIAGDAAAARAAIDAMMADIARATGVTGRLLVRRDRSATWMEIYEGVADPAGFEREMADACVRHEVARLLLGGARHVEAFVASD